MESEIPEEWMPTIKKHNNRKRYNNGPLREQLLAETMEQWGHRNVPITTYLRDDSIARQTIIHFFSIGQLDPKILPIPTFNPERFFLECQKPETNVLTLVNHKEASESIKPIKTRGKYMQLMWHARKIGEPVTIWFGVYFSGLENPVARVYFVSQSLRGWYKTTCRKCKSCLTLKGK